jgi:hypothetical protein
MMTKHHSLTAEQYMPMIVLHRVYSLCDISSPGSKFVFGQRSFYLLAMATVQFWGKLCTLHISAFFIVYIQAIAMTRIKYVRWLRLEYTASKTQMRSRPPGRLKAWRSPA